ncbi:hypothetical protein VP01_807g3 [Puccinia sorghi]|uniref:Uncharacterized protein n=1 Tax=Puccinia sorghi TaxID=27349 RepID=A0A0L6UAA0_9BASI|nr:hypothetical protein VP01_807g3 [Puccinia sorghi]
MKEKWRIQYLGGFSSLSRFFFQGQFFSLRFAVQEQGVNIFWTLVGCMLMGSCSWLGKWIWREESWVGDGCCWGTAEAMQTSLRMRQTQGQLNWGGVEESGNQGIWECENQGDQGEAGSVGVWEGGCWMFCTYTFYYTQYLIIYTEYRGRYQDSRQHFNNSRQNIQNLFLFTHSVIQFSTGDSVFHRRTHHIHVVLWDLEPHECVWGGMSHSVCEMEMILNITGYSSFLFCSLFRLELSFDGMRISNIEKLLLIHEKKKKHNQPDQRKQFLLNLILFIIMTDTVFLKIRKYFNLVLSWLQTSSSSDEVDISAFFHDKHELWHLKPSARSLPQVVQCSFQELIPRGLFYIGSNKLILPPSILLQVSDLVHRVDFMLPGMLTIWQYPRLDRLLDVLPALLRRGQCLSFTGPGAPHIPHPRRRAFRPYNADLTRNPNKSLWEIRLISRQASSLITTWCTQTQTHPKPTQNSLDIIIIGTLECAATRSKHMRRVARAVGDETGSVTDLFLTICNVHSHSCRCWYQNLAFFCLRVCLYGVSHGCRHSRLSIIINIISKKKTITTISIEVSLNSSSSLTPLSLARKDFSLNTPSTHTLIIFISVWVIVLPISPPPPTTSTLNSCVFLSPQTSDTSIFFATGSSQTNNRPTQRQSRETSLPLTHTRWGKQKRSCTKKRTRNPPEQKINELEA